MMNREADKAVNAWRVLRRRCLLDIFNLPAITNLLNRMTDNNAAQRLNLTGII
jgi:hypothetical protein